MQRNFWLLFIALFLVPSAGLSDGDQKANDEISQLKARIKELEELNSGLKTQIENLKKNNLKAYSNLARCESNKNSCLEKLTVKESEPIHKLRRDVERLFNRVPASETEPQIKRQRKQ